QGSERSPRLWQLKKRPLGRATVGPGRTRKLRSGNKTSNISHYFYELTLLALYL
ncbi:hypothetical protein ANANG_G00026340, partial [Anguilla anguilla]